MDLRDDSYLFRFVHRIDSWWDSHDGCEASRALSGTNQVIQLVRSRLYRALIFCAGAR